MAETNRTASGTASHQNEGAEAFDQLLKRIQGIAEDTCTRFGDQSDGRDYVTMRTLVDSEVRRHIASGGGHYEGFIRGLTLMLCLNAEGEVMDPGEYDPNRVMAAAFGEPGIPFG